MKDLVSKNLRSNIYVLYMIASSSLIFLKVFIISFVLPTDQFAAISRIYYYAGFLSIVLPLGGIMYLHTLAPRAIAHEVAAMRHARLDQIQTTINFHILAITIAALSVLAVLRQPTPYMIAFLYAAIYTLMHIDILGQKVLRNYTAFGKRLAQRSAFIFISAISASLLFKNYMAPLIAESVVILALLIPQFRRRGVYGTFLAKKKTVKQVTHFFPITMTAAAFAFVDRIAGAQVLNNADFAKFAYCMIFITVCAALSQIINNKFLPEAIIANSTNFLKGHRRELAAIVLGGGLFSIIFGSIFLNIGPFNIPGKLVTFAVIIASSKFLDVFHSFFFVNQLKLLLSSLQLCAFAIFVMVLFLSGPELSLQSYLFFVMLLHVLYYSALFGITAYNSFRS